MGLLIENKEIVVPGDILATGIDYLPAYGSFREGDNIIASRVGLVNVTGRLINLIPLSGNYIPKAGDLVIGKITNVGFNGWSANIRYAYDASLSLKEATSEFIERNVDLSKYYNIGEIIFAKVIKVTRYKFMDLSMIGPGLRKLKGGRIIEVTPAKVPRLIGKQGSMISLIKDATNCKIIVGQNGRVWIQGDDPIKERFAVEAITQVEKNAHKEGLTDEIKKFLETNKGKQDGIH